MVANKTMRLSPLAQPFVASKSPYALGNSDKVVDFDPLAQTFTPTVPASPSQFASPSNFLDATGQFYPPGHPFTKYTFEPYTSKTSPHAMSVPNNFASNMSAAGIDLRQCSLTHRQSFSNGKRALVCAGEIPVVELPQVLFLAASTKPELLTNGIIKLPDYIDPRGVILLIVYLNKMIHWRHSSHGFRMSSQMDVYDMLTVTAAAVMLGMDNYIDHIYRKCDAQLHNDLPSYDDLDAVAYFVHEHPRFMRIVAWQNLAPRMRSSNIPDPEQFAHYLRQNVVLNYEIQLSHAKDNEYLREKQGREEHHQARIQLTVQDQLNHDRAQAWAKERAEKGEQWEAGRAQREAERQKWEKQEKHDTDKAAKDNAFWVKKKAEEAEDEKSIQNKLKLGVDKRRFTNQERLHWSKTRGTKLPKGC